MSTSTHTTFSYWTRKKLKQTFQLQRVLQLPMLTDWLKNVESVRLTDLEQQVLQFIRQQAGMVIEAWNEEEIKQVVINLILTFINFTILDDAQQTIIAKAFAGRQNSRTSWRHNY